MEYIRFSVIYIIYLALPSYPLSVTTSTTESPSLPLESASSTQTKLTNDTIGTDEKSDEKSDLDQSGDEDCGGDRSDNKCSILAEARRSFFQFFDIFFGTRSNI